MPNIAEAAQKVSDAIDLLRKNYDSAKKPTDKARIARVIGILRRELDAMAGISRGNPYTALTIEFKAAAGRMQAIINDRKQIAASIAAAAEMLDTLTSVIGLIGG